MFQGQGSVLVASPGCNSVTSWFMKRIGGKLFACICNRPILKGVLAKEHICGTAGFLSMSHIFFLWLGMPRLRWSAGAAQQGGLDSNYIVFQRVKQILPMKKLIYSSWGKKTQHVSHRACKLTASIAAESGWGGGEAAGRGLHRKEGGLLLGQPRI